MSLQSVVSKIITGAVTLWHQVETDIDADVAAIKKVLPASAIPNFDAAVSDLKQGASDTLGKAGSSLAAMLPSLNKAIEAGLDGAAATLTNGVAVPYVPMINAGFEDLEAIGIAMVKAKVLKLKAAAAAGTLMTGPAAS